MIIHNVMAKLDSSLNPFYVRIILRNAKTAMLDNTILIRKDHNSYQNTFCRMLCCLIPMAIHNS